MLFQARVPTCVSDIGAMHTSTLQRESSGAGAPARATPGTGQGAPPIKTQLRGLSFAEGEALLSPVQALATTEGQPGEAEGGPGDGLHDPATMKQAMDDIVGYEAYIVNASKYWGVSVGEIKQVICTESIGDKDAVNPKGYRGLMQIGKKEWDEACTKKDLDYSYTSDWNNAEINIFVGTAVYLMKRGGVAWLLAQGKGGPELKPGAAENKNPFDKDHPDYVRITQLAYNGGQGTVVEAMRLAKSTMVDDFTHADYLKPAIAKCIFPEEKFPWETRMGAAFQALSDAKRQEYLKTEAGKTARKTAEAKAASARAEAVQAKYEEMIEYPQQCKAYADEYAKKEAADKAAAEKKAAEDAGGGTGNTTGNDNAAGTDDTAVVSGTVTEDGGGAATATVTISGQYRGLVLERDDSGSDPLLEPAVKEMQALLKANGYRCGSGGHFGVHEAWAVRAFQTNEGLPSTGVCDAATWSLLLYRHAGHRHLTIELFEGGRFEGGLHSPSPELVELWTLLERAGYTPTRTGATLDMETLEQVNQLRARAGLPPGSEAGPVVWALLLYPPGS